MIKGVIKWFDKQKGYGFIEWSDEEDVLVHYSVIENSKEIVLSTGDKVLFLLDSNKGKLTAKKVKKII